jgi:hypothetical protein
MMRTRKMNRALVGTMNLLGYVVMKVAIVDTWMMGGHLR